MKNSYDTYSCKSKRSRARFRAWRKQESDCFCKWRDSLSFNFNRKYGLAVVLEDPGVMKHGYLGENMKFSLSPVVLDISEIVRDLWAIREFPEHYGKFKQARPVRLKKMRRVST